MKTRLMAPPDDGGRNAVAIYDRVYQSAPGVPLAVPDFDAEILAANGWTVFSAAAAPSSTAAYAAGAVSGVAVNPGGAVVGLGVRLYLDGASTPVGVTTTDASGAWSIATGALASGAHSFSVEIDESAGAFVVAAQGAASAMDFSDPANSGLLAALAA
ncbi:hypothetical protein [Methylocella sp.]|uniref:hypothetical protein n=1 Tax=Methylocella sp. TaxID=1978226 RepID=UPI0035B12A8D